MKCLSFFILSAGLFLSSFSLAKEVDNLTGRYKSLQDSTEILDKEMNARLQKLVDAANDKGIACDKAPETFKKIRILFHEQNDQSFGVGALESWADKNEKIPKRVGKVQGSIYEGVLPEDGLKAKILSMYGLSSTIKVNGSLIGTDKLGHFIDQGFERYGYFRQRGNKMDVALDGGKGIENSVYGAATTGVVSYGDMSANYQGILFYHALVDTNNPYLTCSNGTWSQVRTFTWADYVDDAWDEGVNCVKIADPEKAVKYEANLQKLEQQARSQGKNQNYHCPVEPASCGKLYKRYQIYANFLLSPDCIAAGKKNPASGNGGSTGGTSTKSNSTR